MTRLDGPLKREIDIRGNAHVITLTPGGFKLTRKGRRLGLQIAWEDLVSGDAAMAAALNASLAGRADGVRAASQPDKSPPASKGRRRQT